MGTLGFDLLDALRGLRRDRAYAAISIVTLALTIGATTAVFSIVNGVLLRPLPYDQPERLVAIREVWREVAARVPVLEVNERHFDHWRTHATSFESMAQFSVQPGNLTGSGDAVQISLGRASGALFEMLRTPAAIGRALTPADDGDGSPDVAAITDRFWRQRFHGSPLIVGTAIVLDGRPHTVVGVLPASFRLPRRDRLTDAVDAFVPLRITSGWVGDHNHQAVGRLRAGVTIARAGAELDALQAQVSRIASERSGEPVTLSASLAPLDQSIVGGSRRGLLLLLAAVGAVLLIACSNLANLSLTRSFGRRRDAAIRSALGAGRGRLVIRSLVEQLVLAGLGGALGIWVAWMALAVFVQTAPLDLPRAHEVSLDGRALAFAAGLSIAAGLIVAMLPAWRFASGDVQAALRAGAGSGMETRVGLRSHAALLTVQVALSVTLLVVTALFAASFIHLLHQDRGFTAERVLAVEVAVPAVRYADERSRQELYDRLLAAVRALPGVEHAATTSLGLLRGGGQSNFIAREGNTTPVFELPTANYRFVAPEYFRTLGVTIRRGRSFTDAERHPDRPLPALVSEPTAATLWPGEDAIGKRFSRGQPEEQGFEVVGIVADARTTWLEREQPLMVYVPYWWRSRPTMSLLIRTEGDPLSLLPAVRRALQNVDVEIAIGEARPLDQVVDSAMAGRRYQTQLFVTFGITALLIATLGVYAVAAHGISRRRREMNIRIALGARASQVVGLTLRQGMTPVLAGAAAGIAGAVAAGRLAAGLLFEVQPGDPRIITAIVAVVVLAGLATCAVATRQGLAIDPARALRED